MANLECFLRKSPLRLLEVKEVTQIGFEKKNKESFETNTKTNLQLQLGHTNFQTVIHDTLPLNSILTWISSHLFLP